MNSPLHFSFKEKMKQRRNTSSYDGYPWHAVHAEELREKARAYRATHPEYLKRNADKAKQDRLNNPEYFKAREFAREMKKYGTTTEWYRDKLIEQNGLCALCAHLSHARGTIQRLQVDHNHACCDLKTKSCGKCLRGLLCADCNMLLGYLERVVLEMSTVVPILGTWTARAIAYLASYQSKDLPNGKTQDNRGNHLGSDTAHRAVSVGAF